MGNNENSPLFLYFINFRSTPLTRTTELELKISVPHAQNHMEGRQGIRTYKALIFLVIYWSGSPAKSKSYQASSQCRGIIGPPAKRFSWYMYMDPLSHHKRTKTKQQPFSELDPLWKKA